MSDPQEHADTREYIKSLEDTVLRLTKQIELHEQELERTRQEYVDNSCGCIRA